MSKIPLERDILNEVCQYLKSNNFFFWRSNNIPVFGRNNGGKMSFRSMPKHSMKGVPDIIAIVEGMFIGIEVKRPKAKLKIDQIVFQSRCIAHGGQYHVIYSIEDIKAIMGKYIHEKTD